MAFLTRRPSWLLWLGLVLWVCGCASGLPAKMGKMTSPPPAAEVRSAQPPKPAPALYSPAAPRSPIQRIDYQTLEVPVSVGHEKQPAKESAREPVKEPVKELANQEMPPLVAKVASQPREEETK